MKQKQYSPLSVAEMAVSLFAANEGYLDDVAVNKIVDFEAALHAHVNDNFADLMNNINESGNFNDDIAGELKTAIEDFKAKGVF